MSAGSDLDLMTVYAAPPEAASAGRGWSAETFYGRFTQRFIAALSAHTAEGGLYEVDMRLRPTGSKGPVSVRLETLRAYYAEEADPWEFMALPRARVVWASDDGFGAEVAEALDEALRRPRDAVQTAREVRAMRDLMERERAAKGFWDLKLSAGAQVDAEFVGQYRQLMAGAAGRPLTVSTLEALKHDPVLAESWRMHQQLSQLTACAFEDKNDPDQEPPGFQQRLSAAVGAPDFDTLKARLIDLRLRARQAFDAVLPPISDGN